MGFNHVVSESALRGCVNDVEKEYITASVIDQPLLLLVLFAKTFEGFLCD